MDLSFRELKELYLRNKLFVGIRSEDDLQYLLNEGFETKKKSRYFYISYRS